MSLSARRAWIEIRVVSLNYKEVSVALRKESVDRNVDQIKIVHVSAVALRKESVDRNIGVQAYILERLQSLSARRAWIEIPAGCWRDSRRAVALRKESVDRNQQCRNGQNVKSSRSPQGERG